MSVPGGCEPEIDMRANAPERLAGNPPLFVAGYFLHLILPALLAVDVITAWRKGSAFHLRSLDTVVAVVAVLWLVGGCALWFLAQNRQGLRERTARVLLGVYTVYATLILIEALLHLIAPRATIPGLPAPGSRLVFTVYPNQFPGLHGTKTWSVNQLGIRGPMPPRQGTVYRIMAVGGSTTACTMLGDSEEWPHLLMEDLNRTRSDHPVWVGNAGINGTNTVDHLALMQPLPGLIPSDLVIFLVGINDLIATLAYQGDTTQALLENAADPRRDLPQQTAKSVPYAGYRDLRLTLLIRDAMWNLETRFGRSNRRNVPSRREGGSNSRSTAVQGGREIDGRARRSSAPVVPLPDLSTGLKEYRSRIISLANRCRDLKQRCLFLTQPFLWRDNLSASDQRLLWFGWVGFWEHPKGYVPAADLARGLDAYNRAMLEVCSQKGLECYDLARDIPKDTSAFFDDVHFNEGGAQMVAQSLAHYLLSRPPLQ